MAVELVIRDGNPWWMSTDIWVVPGADPDGAPGRPIAGQPAYLWAHVTNSGDSAVQNASVRFYWANPNVGFDRTTANLVGTSFVSLAPTEEADVLCLVPWVPAFVNDGHVCVIAEAFHFADPLPPGPVFNQPTDRHVAQLNLNVLQVGRLGIAGALVEIHNPGNRSKDFVVTVQVHELASIDRSLFERLEVPREALDGGGEIAQLGLLSPQETCPSSDDIAAGPEKIEVRVPAHGLGAVRFGAELNGHAAAVDVLQFENDEIVGGASYILLREA